MIISSAALEKLIITILIILQANFAISQLKTTSEATQVIPIRTDRLVNKYEFEDLSIGDKVPDVKLKMINHSQGFINLSDYKGKLIILDFWATWCSTCISNFPKLEGIQDSFRNDVQIILVNEKNSGDSEIKIQDFYKKNISLTLPTVILDTTLNKLFKHRLIPHYVWIDRECIVQAITTSKDVTIENIQGFVKNKPVKMRVKKDLFTKENPLFKSFNFYDIEKPLYSSNLSRYVEGVGSGRTNSSTGMIKTLTVRNYRIIDMLNQVYHFQYNRIIIEANKREKYISDNSDNWFENNSYCYEVSVPLETSDSVLYSRMKTDLDFFLHLRMKMEKRNIPCYVIRPNKRYYLNNDKINKSISSATSDSDKKIITFNNIKLSEVIQELNDAYKFSSLLKPIFENELEYENLRFNIEIPINGRDNIINLKRYLFEQGFDLLQVEKKIDVFVLSDNY